MMNRLTERDAYWLGEEFWITAREPDDEEVDKVYCKLKHYEDLEESGRLVELPCKVGDTVWELCKCDDDKYRIFPMNVVDINAYGRPNPKWVKNENQPVYNIYAESDYTYLFASFYDIGRIIFLTKAEAEAALKERESE